MIKKIRSKINAIVVKTFNRFDLGINKIRHAEISDTDWALYKQIETLTMTPPDRIFALMDTMNYLCQKKIEGDFVECGVWRGGNGVIAANIFNRYGIKDKQIWLYDTFDGMVEPEDIDKSFKGEIAKEIFSETKTSMGGSTWSYASLDFVKKVMRNTDYPFQKFKFIQGKVEDTLAISSNLPEKICILRLDTDWYTSTKAEMDILFSRLSTGGILIIDDYGDWQGSRKAVDEYMTNHNINIPLFRLGSGARIGVKF
jgi:O-methyltransferase